MAKKILNGVLAATVALIIVVALQPAKYTITRTITVAATPAKVFPLVNNIHRWNDWSPWAKSDPSQKVTYEGPQSGKGAVQSWKGNKTGTGRMELVQSQPNRLVRFSFEFHTPMAGSAEAEFKFAPAGKGTSVTWSMTGSNSFMGKAFNLLMNMNKMLGNMLEKG